MLFKGFPPSVTFKDVEVIAVNLIARDDILQGALLSLSQTYKNSKIFLQLVALTLFGKQLGEGVSIGSGRMYWGSSLRRHIGRTRPRGVWEVA